MARPWLVAFALAVFACPVSVGPEDRGRLRRAGFELRPAALPWFVSISPEVEQRGGAVAAFEAMNRWLAPLQAFEVVDDFDSLALAPLGARHGTILVFQGFAGTPTEASASGETVVDPGARAFLAWNEEGEIFAVDIVLSSDIAYDPQTVRDTMAHEAGHALGLGHDGRSQDLRSCMSSPPAYDCRLTPADVRLVKGD